MNLFELVGKIAISGASDAQNDIDNTSKKASNAGENFKKGITTVGKWGAAIGTAAVAASAALVKFASDSAATADNVDKMSQKIGISREAYQELDFICSQSGTSVDTLQAGIKTLTAAMDKAASGTAANVEQFESLGISVTDANGELRSQEEIMWETMSALQGMENQTEKARLATELFGRSGTELMPLLNSEAGSMEEMKNQAHELGLVLDDETVDAGVSLTDTLDQLKRSFGAVATKLGSTLMPYVEKFCNFILDNMPTIQGVIETLAPTFMNFLDQMLPILMDLVEQALPLAVELINSLIPLLTSVASEIFPIVINVISQLLPIVKQILPIFTKIVEAVLPVFVKILNFALPLIVDLLNILLPIVDGILTPILDLLMPILDLLMPIFELIGALLKPLLQLVGAILTPLIKILSTIFGIIIDTCQPIIKWLADFLGNVLSKVINALIPIVEKIGSKFVSVWQNIKKIWSGAGTFFKTIFNGIVGILNKAIDGVNILLTPMRAIISAVGKMFGASWSMDSVKIPHIPQLEEGGVLKKGQVGFLEGNGDEAVVPLEKNTGWIDRVAEKINGSGSNDVVKKLDELINAITSMNIVLDTGAMVGEMTPAFDTSLGNLYAAKGRGRS